MKYTELETKRLILRKFTEDDLEFVFDHFKDEFVSRYLYDNEPPKDREDAKGILDWCMNIQSGDHIRWCIILKQNMTPIGTIGFHRYDKNNNAAEIGYDLSIKHTRLGIMSEALHRVIEYGFSEFKLHRIYATVAINNLASNTLLDKNGFALEGIMKDRYLFRGKYYDHNLWALINPGQV